MSIFTTFRSAKSAVAVPMICYSLAVLSFLCSYLWSIELESKGYFTIRQRYHVSYFEGEGALTTILAMKLIGVFFVLVTVYYAISSAKFIREYNGPYDIERPFSARNIFNFLIKFEYRKTIEEFDPKISFKFLYFVFWIVLVTLIYYYLQLDSVIAFIFISLPFLVITLFLPLFFIDAYVLNKTDSQRSTKKLSKAKIMLGICWFLVWILGFAILFSIIDPWKVVGAGIIAFPIILSIFLLPLIPLLKNGKET